MKKLNDKIIGFLKNKKQTNDEGAVFASGTKHWMSRKIIDSNYNNYEGIYVDPYMANGEKKLFYPLTAMTVNNIAAHMDFDVKDIKVTPKTEQGRGTALLLRSKLHAELEKNQFGGLLNEAINEILVQGTLLTRTYRGEDGLPKTDIVDLRNTWTEWHTNKPAWYLERVYFKKGNLPSNFKYKDKVTTTSAFMDRFYVESNDDVDCWRYEGRFPLSFVTDNEDDTKEVFGVIWVSNLQTNPVIQDIYLPKKGKAQVSYSYGQLVPKSYRWLGKGISESLMDLQEDYNEMMNYRKQRGKLSTVGLNLIKRGSGITPDMVSNLYTGSGIVVGDINNDIKRMDMGDIPNGSFNQELRIQQMADRLTGSNELSRGEGTSLQTATEAEILRLSSDTRFALYREQVGFVIEDIVKKWLDIIIDELKEEETVTLLANMEERKQLARGAALRHIVNQMKETVKKRGIQALYPLANADVNGVINDMLMNLTPKYMAKTHWKLLKESAKSLEYELAVNVSSEADTSALKGKNLTTLLDLVAKGFITDLDPNEIAIDMLESFGMNSFRYKKSNNNVLPGLQAQQGVNIAQ